MSFLKVKIGISLISLFFFSLSANSELHSNSQDEVSLKFKAESMGPDNHEVTLYKVGNSEYCQKDWGAQLGETLSFKTVGEELSTKIEKDTLFCVKVEDHITRLPMSQYIKYFGPYIASPACQGFTSYMYAYLYPASKECIPSMVNNNQYYTETITVTNIHGESPSTNASNHNLRLRKRHKSPLCARGTGRGDVMYEDRLVDIINNEFVDYDNVTGIKKDEQFCVAVTLEEGITKYYAGPFVMTGNCKGTFNVYRDVGVNIANANGCTSPSKMILFENHKYALPAETATHVEILNADRSSDCSKRSNRGKTVLNFEFFPDRIQNVDKNIITDANQKFCLVVTKGNDETVRAGPFKVNDGCTIKIYSGNVVQQENCH